MKNVFLKLEASQDKYDYVQDFVAHELKTRQEMGQAVTDLLNYFADGQHDFMVAELLTDFILDYINDRI